jgi:anaerobic selenocysteine-containing dehydrogenase
VSAGGGFPAIVYTARKAFQSGNPIDFARRMRSRNACKTCALGMGGLRGGMVNEAGHFPEFCKKSVQAQAGDMHGTISEDFFARTPLAQLRFMTSGELERLGRLAFPIIASQDDTHYRRVGWDEALDLAATAFIAAEPDQTFFYSSGRSSNEAPAWLWPTSSARVRPRSRWTTSSRRTSPSSPARTQRATIRGSSRSLSPCADEAARSSS